MTEQQLKECVTSLGIAERLLVQLQLNDIHTMSENNIVTLRVEIAKAKRWISELNRQISIYTSGMEL